MYVSSKGPALDPARALEIMFTRAPRRQFQSLCADVSHRRTEKSVLTIFQRPCRLQSTGTENSTSGTESSSSASENPPTPQDSIFSKTQSPWDHVFKNVPSTPQLLPATLRNPLGGKRPRKQTMTAREISAFEDMFNMIFDAVAEQKIGDSLSSDKPDVGIGKRGGIGDLIGKLRRHSKKMKWTTEEDELLDRKKEEMDLCDTDQQLLDWAMREVFGESEKYEQEAKKAMETVSQEEGNSKLPMHQSPTYPHLLALLMKTFRDKYRDPHLALSIFDHARHLSIASYVFGCSTGVYNELIETRWRCFRDLKGVHDTLEEMSVNGVDFDTNTRKLAERVRREVGERNLWIEEVEVGGNEAWNMLNKIENIVAQSVLKPEHKTKVDEPKSPKWDDWKSQRDDAEDEWEFDLWEKSTPKSRR
ncbi:hypothetical protein E1B28_010005 [Marasmius oreades]|uniref:Mtf2-like C-terminal domain-containing protein n=1 Tax=Marasmius oreades TaxID=181124 RepID=A0A9P7UQP4_9AGAR|nr:uncharacterized protein E1B28_010005 [Marasmius oreades]KAG7090932.1 hypothetical protein E1B28_010005 [Marasmius oreades]